MTAPNRKLTEYLEEARESEQRLARSLEHRIELAPRGDYRRDLLRALRESRDHAQRLSARLRAMGRGGVSIRALIVDTVRGAAGVLWRPFARPAQRGPDAVLGTVKSLCAIE